MNLDSVIEFAPFGRSKSNDGGGGMQTMTKLTMRQSLFKRLSEATTPVAVHELAIVSHSENALATELSIMARQGFVIGAYREGKKFKEWTLTEKGRAEAAAVLA